MKVVILCGGFGTRMQSHKDNIPKPMIMIGDKPILWHIMKYYSSWGHNEFILCLGYQGWKIKEYFMNYKLINSDFSISLNQPNDIQYHNRLSEEDWEITMVETGLDSMTGSRIKQIQKYIGDDSTFMLTYGDGVCNLNINRQLDFHHSHGKILTVTGISRTGQYGELQCDSEGHVTEFQEKPQVADAKISGGYFICNRGIFEYLDNDKELVFEKEPLQKLMGNKQMMVYNHSDFWGSMDTYKDQLTLNEMYENMEAPWKLWN
ncbi:glucose-1-phosphate cytidylyltransferase [Bacillus thuringiensis]|uniref:glucose-1-phosphate cytidylyltransferase n=1 Tax=Bacillus thuringiensis TaxID=1428 RepID=UPI000BF6CDF4|nr:glucose-1-phosphate cytidylyltransferase [Bacillus thuringiensis]PFA09996.1 glucose-1-phosphate cytidylyltransferase [Bacillus thuringiensis]